MLRQRLSNQGIYLKSAAELAVMRRGGHLLQRIMREVAAAAVEGVTTLELDTLAHARIVEAGAKPAFLGLYGFPNTLCISPNEAVVHGIPNRVPLEKGDILSIDCGLVLGGFYADTARTVAIGEVGGEARRLLAVTERSLYAGLGAARVGGRVGDIGAAVEKVVRAAGFRCVDEYTGHGIGRRLHEDPKVFNTSMERGRRIAAGLTVAVEPMVNIGTSKTVTLEDKWTVVSADGSLSAHFEHTAAVTADGVEVLTMDPTDEGMVALAREAGLLWREP